MKDSSDEKIIDRRGFFLRQPLLKSLKQLPNFLYKKRVNLSGRESISDRLVQ